MLTLVDTISRFSPALEVRQSFKGADVVAVLERASQRGGLPRAIRLDNGPEFFSKE